MHRGGLVAACGDALFASGQGGSRIPAIVRAGLMVVLFLSLGCGETVRPRAAACAPACRAGFTCIAGICKSACNPACPVGQTCTAEARCEPDGQGQGDGGGGAGGGSDGPDLGEAGSDGGGPDAGGGADGTGGDGSVPDGAWESSWGEPGPDPGADSGSEAGSDAPGERWADAPADAGSDAWTDAAPPEAVIEVPSNNGCDPYEQDCEPGQKCDIACGATGAAFACSAFDGSGGAHGSPCGATPCFKGNICLTIVATSVCRRYCSVDGDCPSGSRCETLEIGVTCGGGADGGATSLTIKACTV